MPYQQQDPLKNLDSKNNQKKKTRAQHLKDYAAMMTKKGLKPEVYEFYEYMKDIRKQNTPKRDSVDYQGVTGQWYRMSTKTRKSVKVDPPKKKKKKGGM